MSTTTVYNTIQYLFSKTSTINNTFNTIFDTYIFRSLIDTDSQGCLSLSPEYIITIITRQSEMANTSPRHMPVLGNVHPIKIENVDIFS